MIARDGARGGSLALVTGGLGFLGSHLVTELRRRGSRVRVLDDGSNARAATRAAFGGDAGIECWEGSVCDRSLARQAVEGAAEVYHLAAIVGVRRVASDPWGVLRSNVDGARAIVEACSSAGTPLLFVSSSEVYGDGAPGKAFREEDAPGFDAAAAYRDGRVAYALSKWIGEQRCLEASSRGLPVVVARPFNAVGAGQSEASGALVPSLVAAALRGEALPIEGDGLATRAFADAAEIAAAFVDLLRSGRAFGHAVNVGSDDVRSILEVARLVRDAAGLDVPLAFAPEVPAVCAVRHRRPDLARLGRTIGWVPARPIEGALARAVASARLARGGAAVVA